MSSKTKEPGKVQERTRPHEKKEGEPKIYEKEGMSPERGLREREREREPQGLQRALQEHPGLYHHAQGEPRIQGKEDVYGTQLRGYTSQQKQQHLMQQHRRPEEEEWQEASGRYPQREWSQESQRFEQGVGEEGESHLDSEVEQGVNHLITTFINNSLEYITVSALCYSPCVALPNTARFFKLIAKGNKKGGKKLMRILVASGGEVKLSQINAPQCVSKGQCHTSSHESCGSLLPLVERAIQLETKESQIIQQVHSAAKNEPMFLPLLEIISKYQTCTLFALKSMQTELKRASDNPAMTAMFDANLGLRVDKWKCKMKKAKKLAKALEEEESE